MALRGYWSAGRLHLHDGADTAIGGRGVDFGKTNSGAALHGAGTSSSRLVSSTAGVKFLSYYVEASATSGDARAMYLRLYISGAGGGGEAARIFGTVQNVAAATARGAHISLSLGTTGSVTGLGVAVHGTLHVPGAMTGGTYAAINAEVWADAETSSLASATNKSFFRVGVGGNATGYALLDAELALFDFYGVTAASGTFIDTDITTHTAYAGIPIIVPGVGTRYLAVVSA